MYKRQPFAGFWSKDEILLFAYDKSPVLYFVALVTALLTACLLYTSDAADERSSVDLGGRRIIKKKK